VILKLENQYTVSFPNSDFSEWNKKTPEANLQEFSDYGVGWNYFAAA
jgi:hypothetical protein